MGLPFASHDTLTAGRLSVCDAMIRQVVVPECPSVHKDPPLPSWGPSRNDLMGGPGPPRWLRLSSVCLQCGRPGFNPRVGKISWRRKWKPTPVFSRPGESHGRRSLLGYSPRGHKESTTTSLSLSRSPREPVASVLPSAGGTAFMSGLKVDV